MSNDRLHNIKAWIGDRADRDSIVIGRKEAEWLVSEVEWLRGQRDVDRKAVSALVQFRQDIYQAAGLDESLSPGRNDDEVVQAVESLHKQIDRLHAEGSGVS